jgi:hypothetical protein
VQAALLAPLGSRKALGDEDQIDQFQRPHDRPGGAGLDNCTGDAGVVRLVG